MWHCQWAQQRQLEAGSSARRVLSSPSSSWERKEFPIKLQGLCFKCFGDDHKKKDCTNHPMCFRCGFEGHESFQCKRHRSPASERELIRAVLAKMGCLALSAVVASVERHTSPAPRQEVPLVPPSPAAAEPLSLVWPSTQVSSGVICVLCRSRKMDDMERRLRLVMVAYIGGVRLSVFCVEAGEAISV